MAPDATSHLPEVLNFIALTGSPWLNPVTCSKVSLS
jgi:hypothetical protein